MKKGLFLLSTAFLVLLSCGISCKRNYTYEELQRYTDELTPLGTHFWDEFGYLRDTYGLTDSESKVLGEWNGFQKRVGWTFIFYPNRLFVVLFGVHKYKTEENMYLHQGYGIWELRGNALVVTMYKFRKTFSPPEGDRESEISEYFDITPYEAPVININDIDSGGYTRKPFERFVLPDELRPQIHIPPEAKKKAVMVRSIYNIHVITNSGKPEKSYGYLKVVPDMAADNVSGLDVATSTDLAKKYFENLVF